MTAPTTRLLTLLSLLQTRRDWSGSSLAGRLGISQRTVRRDIDRLREMGYNIQATMGPEGGYWLHAGNELPPLLFDDDQVVALAVALHSATASGVGIEESSLRALTTIRQVMPSRLRHRLDALSITALSPHHEVAAQQETVAPDVLLAISAAVRASEVLRFDYSSRTPSDDEAMPPPRRVEPHHLVMSKGRWHLLAWEIDRDDWRLFRVDRITPRSQTGPRFVPREIPGGDAGEYVSARFKGSEQVNRWPCYGKVIVHLPARKVLPFVGDGIVEDLGPERCSLEVGSWSWVALAASLNRFDTDIDVIGPPELQHAFGVLAARNAATSAG